MGKKEQIIKGFVVKGPDNRVVTGFCSPFFAGDEEKWSSVYADYKGFEYIWEKLIMLDPDNIRKVVFSDDVHSTWSFEDKWGECKRRYIALGYKIKRAKLLV